MTNENQKPQGPRRSERVSAVLRCAAAMQELETAFANEATACAEEKRRGDHFERLHDKDQVEIAQLREMLDRALAERDGYFKDASVLRASLMNARTVLGGAVNSTADRQAFAPPAARRGAEQIDDGADIPPFLREGSTEPPPNAETERRSSDILSRLSTALSQDRPPLPKVLRGHPFRVQGGER